MSFPEFMEKAETGALGRALALIGYGTQFCADDLDEGDRIVDSPVKKPAYDAGAAPEVVRATSVGLTTRNSANRDPERALVDPGEFVVHFGKKYMGRKVKDIPRADLEGYVQWLESNSAKKNQKPTPEVELLKQAVDRYYHPEKYESRTTAAAGLEGMQNEEDTEENTSVSDAS
jgi:hypothetical protein